MKDWDLIDVTHKHKQWPNSVVILHAGGIVIPLLGFSWMGFCLKPEKSLLLTYTNGRPRDFLSSLLCSKIQMQSFSTFPRSTNREKVKKPNFVVEIKERKTV